MAVGAGFLAAGRFSSLAGYQRLNDRYSNMKRNLRSAMRTSPQQKMLADLNPTKADRVLTVHDFYGENYKNCQGASSSDPERSWLRVYMDACAKNEKPVSGLCAAINNRTGERCQRDAAHGGHVMFSGRGNTVYLLPLCDRHNSEESRTFQVSSESNNRDTFSCASHAAVKLYHHRSSLDTEEEYSEAYSL